MKKEKLGLKNFKIRAMSANDLDEVFKIENLSNPTPWSSSSFLDCLKGNYLNLVVEDKKQVIGYCISTINFTESHLLNISINPNYRNLGIGETLLDNAEKECIKKGVKDIFLEVRKSNQPAIYFYEKMNYRYVGLRKNYYKTNSGREDGLIYSKHMEINKLISIFRQLTYVIKNIISFKYY